MKRLIRIMGFVGMLILLGPAREGYSFSCCDEEEEGCKMCKGEGGPLVGYYWPKLDEYNKELKKMGLSEIDGNWVVGGKCLHAVRPNFKMGFSIACTWIQSDKIVGGTVTETSLGVVLPALVCLYQIPCGKGTISLGGGVGYYPVWYRKEITPPNSRTTISKLYGGDFGGQVMVEGQYQVKKDCSIVGEIAYVMGKVDELKQAGEKIPSAPEIDLSGLMVRLGCRCKF